MILFLSMDLQEAVRASAYFYPIKRKQPKKKLRKELDYQCVQIKELSARTGIPVATLDCYLGARATTLSVDAAVKSVRALRVSVEYLVICVDAAREKPEATLSREALEIIRWIENLNSEQCKALLRLIKTLRI